MYICTFVLVIFVCAFMSWFNERHFYFCCFVAFVSLPPRDDDYVNCRKVKGKLNTSAFSVELCCVLFMFVMSVAV